MDNSYFVLPICHGKDKREKRLKQTTINIVLFFHSYYDKYFYPFDVLNQIQENKKIFTAKKKDQYYIRLYKK
jgi:hypothetical protein